MFTYTNSQSIKRKRRTQLTKLYLPNANYSIDLIDDYLNLNSLGIGIVNQMLLNQLLSKFIKLNRLEIKVREELIGEFIATNRVKELRIHSLAVRVNVNSILDACKSIEFLSLLNCLFNEDTVGILIKFNCIQSIEIQNNYWDDDRQFDYLLIRCFEKCQQLTNGYFKNVNLKQFFNAIYLLAIQNSNKLYKLHLDYLDSTADLFGGTTDLDSLDQSNLPANLKLYKLQTDYNY